MQMLKVAVKKVFIILSIVTLMSGIPLSAYAESANTGSDSSDQQAQDTPQEPPFVYDPVTGHWNNDKYSWDPATGQTTLIPPKGPTTTPGPTGTTGKAGDSTTGTNADATAADATGPGSNNSTTNNGSSNSQADTNNTAKVTNTLGEKAFTGNSSVAKNTLAGSALTGNASSIANILNTLQSSTSLGNQGMTTFQSDITGDVVGDLLINPDLIFNLGPGSQNSSITNQNDKTTVNVNTNAALDNNANLSAKTGDASVDANTEAGDATSGNAYVMANVVNVLNSVISANKSFLGMINIYGNLNGDILFPPETINKLLTSNVPTSTVSIDNETGNITLNSNNNQAINNNIKLSANSGTAAVTNNTQAGDATTGSAKTNLTVLNLTGHDVVGADSILVFVNVLGTWVGMIMDAPAGATAAAIGGGVTNDTTNRSLDATATTNNNATINNDLDLNASTGNATVSNNSKAGSAKSGDAYAAANVANVNNSSLNLSNWFGVLFINVFGSWNGSFGVDTLAGTVPKQTATSAGASDGSNNPRVFSFAAAAAKTGQPNQHYVVQEAASTGNNDKVQLIPSATVNSTGGTGQNGSTEALMQATKKNNHQTMIITGAGLLIGVSLLGAERVVTAVQSRRGKRDAFAGISTATAVGSEE